MECNEDCDFSKWDTNQTLWFFAENDMKFTKNPWYFFGDDFFFTKAEVNFTFAESVIEYYRDIKMSIFSEYLKEFSGEE